MDEGECAPTTYGELMELMRESRQEAFLPGGRQDSDSD
jgi:hypothetical protein